MDKTQFKRVWDENYGKLFLYAHRVTKDMKAAKEIVIDSFAKFYRYEECKMSHNEEIRVLLTIVRDTALEYLKSRGCRNEAEKIDETTIVSLELIDLIYREYNHVFNDPN